MTTHSSSTLPPAGASAWVTIDLRAIADNVRALAAHAPGAEVMAIVKADAYGHGLLPAARAARAGGATWLGCAQLSEALSLRAAGATGPILTWIYPPGAGLHRGRDREHRCSGIGLAAGNDPNHSAGILVVPGTGHRPESGKVVMGEAAHSRGGGEREPDIDHGE